VIGLANSLGMCTLAEGVEDEIQLAELRAHGCRMVQGWLFGKAMPAAHYQPGEVGEVQAASRSNSRRWRKPRQTVRRRGRKAA
jgi:EAL domain-containing protein (putative c-di-GMP-specific phosphodiesterase class I)